MNDSVLSILSHKQWILVFDFVLINGPVPDCRKKMLKDCWVHHPSRRIFIYSFLYFKYLCQYSLIKREKKYVIVLTWAVKLWTPCWSWWLGLECHQLTLCQCYCPPWGSWNLRNQPQEVSLNLIRKCMVGWAQFKSFDLAEALNPHLQIFWRQSTQPWCYMINHV